MKKLLLLPLISFFIVLLNPSSVTAVTCDRSGTIDESCSFFHSVDGVDAGTGSTNTAELTVSNSVLTVTAGQTIASGTFILGSGGSIVLPADGSGQIIPNQPLWLKGGFYDSSYPANEVPSLTQTDGTYARLNTFTNKSCKAAESCPTACGESAITKAGNVSMINVDGSGNCLYRTCAATAACDAECTGQPNGTVCGELNECFNVGGGQYLTKHSEGSCYYGACTGVSCTQAELWTGGCWQTHVGPGSC